MENAFKSWRLCDAAHCDKSIEYLKKTLWKFILYSSLSYNRAQQFINFLKNPTCTLLFLPAHSLIWGNFQAKMIFIRVINGKFQSAWLYFILHVYQSWDFFHPSRLFHPIQLLDRLEYIRFPVTFFITQH